MKFLETRRGVVCSAFLILSVGASREAWPGDDGFALRTQMPPGIQHAALRRAVMGARGRLARPECQQVFSEFKDALGRTLQEKLDAEGHTAASYLGLIVFADGARLRQCHDPNVFALTGQGSRVVFVAGVSLPPWTVTTPARPRRSSSTRSCTPSASARTRPAQRRSPRASSPCAIREGRMWMPRRG